MHRVSISRLWLAAFIAVLPAANAQSLVERVQAALDAFVTEAPAPGISAAIWADGKVAFEGGSGFADIKGQRKADASMVHRTASIAKPMTATGVMRLVERGKIDLDAEIQTYLPDFPKKEWPITIRHLLSHTSGIRHYRGLESTTNRHFASFAEAMTIFQGDKTAFQPGTDYLYTTYGYTVLGAIVEKASGQSFEDFMRANVWGLAGMSSTQLEVRGRDIPSKAVCYMKRQEAEFVVALPTDLSVKYPGGGMVTVASDLLRFGHAFLEGKLVSPATRDDMLAVTSVPGQKDHVYGLGWEIRSDKELGSLISHSGGQSGTSTNMAFYRDRGIGVAVLVNVSNVRMVDIARQLAKAALDGN